MREAGSSPLRATALMQAGQAHPAIYREDNSLLIGSGIYTDDLRFEQETWGVFVRSTHAHADILHIAADLARNAPGVVAVFTAEDLGATGPLLGDPSPLRPSTSDVPRLFPLAAGQVRHVGEPVALVVAESLFAALDASMAVAIAYRPLLATVGGLAAVQDAGNMVATFRLGDPERTALALAQAPRLVSTSVSSPRIAGMPMEPRAAIATWTSASGYTLHAPLQAPHLARDILAPALGVEAVAIRIVVPRMGGGFGTRLLPVREDAALLLAARKIGRPVRWRADRTEGSMVDVQARDQSATITGGFALDGQLLGARIDVVANVGAYPTYFAVPISTTTGSRIVDGPYRIPTIDVTIRCVATHTVPMGPYRGAGRPEVIHRLERLLECAAIELGLDPVDIRRRNLIPGAAMPFRNNAGQLYDSGDYPKVLETALKLSDWSGFSVRRLASEARGRLRGHGLCCHIDTTSGINPSESVVIRLAPNGRIEVLSGTQEMGQSLAATYRQLAAAEIQVPIEMIDIVQGDTARVASGVGSYGSRSLFIGGSAVHGAAISFRKTLADSVGELLEVEARDIVFDLEGAKVAGTDRGIGWLELSSLCNIRADGEFSSTFTFPNGCYVCEVEIDKDTGVVKVERFIAVDDVGNVVNPTAVHGQIHGGVMQGIGQALMERCVYDENGQLLTASFADYAMPRAIDQPSELLAVTLENWPSPVNPLGAKGAGENGAVGTPPAVVAAVVDALRLYGVQDITMPIHPETVWRLIRDCRWHAR
jgi:aerobic carbon-monoxide dehydrogenase large subunit